MTKSTTAEELQRFHAEMERRIANREHESIFNAGGCFQFALRLHERFGYKIRGIHEGYEGGLSHVWCEMANGKCVDIRGVSCEEEIVTLANGSTATVRDVCIDEIHRRIAEKKYPAELANRILMLADSVFDTDEKFAAAKPQLSGPYTRCDETA